MNIYIGNLPWSATEDEIRQLFAQHGDVTSVKIITDPQSGRSKGFGFVEMASDDAGQAAVSGLDGTELGGRKIVVNPARPKGEGSGAGRSRGSEQGFTSRPRF